MNSRPRLLHVLSISFLLLCLTPFLRVLHSQGLGAFAQESLIDLFTLRDWTLVLTGLLGALLARNASRVLAMGVPLLSLLAGLEIFWEMGASKNFLHASPSFWSASIFLATQILWLFRGPRKALLNPRSRWWTTPKRITVSAVANIRTGFGKTFVSRVTNLSKEGIQLDSSAEFQKGQYLNIRFLLGPLCVIQCKAEVVRKQNRPDHASYGLRILEMRTNSRLQMKRYMERTVPV